MLGSLFQEEKNNDENPMPETLHWDTVSDIRPKGKIW